MDKLLQHIAVQFVRNIRKKMKRSRWVGYVAYKEIKNAYRILVKNIMGRDHVGDLRADNKTVLKWVLETIRRGQA